MTRVVVTTCIASLLVAVGMGAIYFYGQVRQQQEKAVLSPVTVSYRTLIGQVMISGTSKASETVNLAFKTGGIADAVPVSVGQSVATGTLLISLRSNALNNQVAQARANLSVQLAKLRDIQNGTRSEQLAVTKAELQGSNSSLESARHALLVALGSAQSAADIVVRFTLAQFITNPATSNEVSLRIGSGDSLLGSRVIAERKQIEPIIVSWTTRLTALQNADTNEALSASDDMHSYLLTISTMLDQLTQILSSSIDQFSSSQQEAIATARTSIHAADSDLTAATQALRNAEAAFGVAERQFDLSQAGSTSAAVAAQQAMVEGARAQVAELLDLLAEQSITAPFSGVVTALDAKAGETVAPGATAVTLISSGPLKIEGFVPEVHYREIALGQPVRITLDAFPDETFSGVLELIEPTATMRNGVPNFKVTITFTNEEPRIRPGLTGDAIIETAHKESALSVPLAAVSGSGPNATVMLSNGTRVPVRLGITSADGFVEILSGLSEGDVVLVDVTTQYRIVPN